jgi:hypothetical protein
MAGHRQGDDDINFVGLFFFGDAPTSWRLDGNGTADGEADR